MVVSGKSFFFFLLMMGVVLSVSSDSWFGAWFGLELNLMSFVPFIISKGNVYSSEASMKYFLIQAMGSAIVLLGSLEAVLEPKFMYLMVIALLLKMGAAPFHFWFPQVMSGLGWVSCFVLMSVQKIAPMLLLSYTMSVEQSSNIMFCSALSSALVGSLGGLNQVFLRKIMGFSSINHMSWLLMALMVSEVSWMVYFVFYVLISGSVLSIFYNQQIYHIMQLSGLGSSYSIMGYMSLLSLGGLPPFSGFIPKWVLMQELVVSGMVFSLVFLLSGTLISLYYYLRITLFSLSMSSVTTSFMKAKFQVSNKVSLFLIVNFIGLMIPSLFMLV